MREELMFKTIYCHRCGYEKDINFYDDYDSCPTCGRSLKVVSRQGICDECGCEVSLDDSPTNECECGVLYNAFGQRLLPREEWGEYCDDYDY